MTGGARAGSTAIAVYSGHAARACHLHERSPRLDIFENLDDAISLNTGHLEITHAPHLNFEKAGSLQRHSPRGGQPEIPMRRVHATHRSIFARAHVERGFEFSAEVRQALEAHSIGDFADR